MTDTALAIPSPLDWQRTFLDLDRQDPASLTAVCVGRRAGKSHLGLLWLTFAPGGLMEGKPVAVAAPTDAHQADIRQTFHNWFHPLIIGKSPGGLGFELVNGARIDFWSLSPGHNAFRGRGYSLAWIDESAFVRNLTETIEQNLTPALAQYQGRKLLTSTPRGFNQYHDWFRKAEREGRVITGPSTLNPHISAKWLAEQRKSLPPAVFEQEILARFLTIDSGIIKREDIRLGTPPPLDQFLTLSLGLDFALTEKKTSDFSAAVLAGVDRDKQTWILKSERWRTPWPETFQRVLQLYELFKPQIVFTESVSFSELCVRELIAAGVPIDAIKPSTDKVARLSPIAMRYRLGMIRHSIELPQDLEDEILMFPNGGEHDDQCDALVYAVAGLDKTIRDGWSESSNRFFSSSLPHEKRRGSWGHDCLGNPIWFGEDPPPPGTEVPRPTFREEFIGDEYVVIDKTSGQELHRGPRGRFHLYLADKSRGLLPWAEGAKWNGRTV